ncbi:hypothetical protein SAMN05660443_1442 [Marinospirillum celere]|uniref:DUF1289 domain-containing protein n=1 Tax=Marinospirillum celere TaxID=1122252 RepID=A0A1I1GC12_9GAMM|nr:DUF1289 domain-containing protein [Marinospirillum celere]SFC07408.1 hypothetical protein SAMN05660443_1442 [Marinospirillum celere]
MNAGHYKPLACKMLAANCLAEILFMKSPCVGFCSTTFGDPVCRGCKRTTDEVDRWNRMSPAQQNQVWKRLWRNAETLVKDYVLITDQALLRKQLKRFGVRHHPRAPAEAWVIDLLRAGSEKIDSLEAYGLKKTAKAQHLSPAALYNQLNQRLIQACSP